MKIRISLVVTSVVQGVYLFFILLNFLFIYMFSVGVPFAFIIIIKIFQFQYADILAGVV